MQQNTQNQKNNLRTESILGKSLPFSLEAEKAVLGAILLNDKKIEDVLEIVKPEDFYLPSHIIIFEAMTHIIAGNQRIDLVTIQDHLEKTDNLFSSCGGASYLIALQEDIPAVGLIEQHAKIIKEKSILRKLIESASTIITNCYAQDEEGIENVVDQAEKTILNISTQRTAQNFVPINIWLKKTFQTLSEMKSHSQGITGVPTTFDKLNNLTSGFQRNDLIVLASRPSMGKTTLALNWAAFAATQGLNIGFFSLEMSAEQLTVRLLAADSGISQQRIRNATINSDEWVELTNVAAKLSEQKFFIDDTPSQSITDVRARARRLKHEHGLHILFVDYLQLIRGGNKKFENRHQEVSEISRSLKALAKELDIPIIALSQLSRAVDARVDKRPMLSDLRESGAIEQDADLIMFLYRDALYHPETDNPSLAELIIGKQRNGPTGRVYLDFQKELTLFQELSHYDSGDFS